MAVLPFVIPLMHSSSGALQEARLAVSKQQATLKRKIGTLQHEAGEALQQAAAKMARTCGRGLQLPQLKVAL